MQLRRNQMIPTAIALVIGSAFIAAGFILAGQAPVPLPAQSGSAPGVSSPYLTHISTDKPIYRIGEKVYVRGVVLRAGGHLPLNTQGPAGAASFQIRGPKGDVVASGASSIIDSVIGFSWDIPSEQTGGEYTIQVTLPFSGLTSERKFDIRAYRSPRLKSQIVFVRDGYGPGDTVAANLHVERAEGGIPARAKVTVTARLDGDEIWKGSTTIDNAGNAGAIFKLPASISRGDGVIAMVIEDGGVVETATKTIPILLQTIDVAIYPEGGDLVAGLPNRVYIEGRTPSLKPADMAGVIVNGSGKEVAAFRTEHEGRGRFSFIPVKGKSYALRLTEPAGIQKTFPLPEVKGSGAVITSTSDVTPKRRDVVVRVGASASGEYGIALSQRGNEIAFKSVGLKANQMEDVAFTVPLSLDGVIVATVYDERKTPIAERLLFRQPERTLNVRVVADRTDYVPGERVTLRITTTDGAGRPVGAIVGMTATDSSVLEMIEKREQAPRLPVMALLESEVKDLADAHVYLDENNPKAPLATDLLLGTQGWRRFITTRKGLLSGTVSDWSNAVIPGVSVRAVNTITGATLDAVTNERGAYSFTDIPIGAYRISASLPGFITSTAASQVALNSSTRQDLRLSVAAQMMMVEVAAAAGRVMPAVAPARVINFAAMDAEVGGPIAGKDVLDLKPIGNFEIALAGDLRRRDAAGIRKEAVANIVTVREYAHTLRPNYSEGSRTDFTETVYWNAGVRTGASTGTATVSFNLSDSVTSFRVLADAFSQDGALGAGVTHVESVQPFSIEPKLPLQITSGDVIQLPVAVINGVNRELRGADLSVKGPSGVRFTVTGGNLSTLRAKERARQFVQLDTGSGFSGAANLTFDGRAGAYRDSVTRTIDVQPLGFPHEISTGGVLERNASTSFEFMLPAEMVRGSLSSNITVYPTPLANMTNALQALLQEPYGCFEQTSSTSCPMVMAQQYFLTHTGVDPKLVEKARDLLDVSYKRLTGFESRSRGYEWFGADPGHEALTAYGLLQFTDMARVRNVDKEMLDRTRAWLLARRDGAGGFRLDSKALDSFGHAPAETTNAYIVWALSEAGEKNLSKEIAALKASAASSQDSYVVALAANVLHATGDRSAATSLMDKLARNQTAAGSVKGAVTSITRSGGEALEIETTALSTLAWMREPAYAGNVEKSLKWIVESNKNGRYGSTQSTVLALRTIIAYDSAHARPKAPGRVVLTIDGKRAGEPIAFTADSKGALTLPALASDLTPGKHRIELKMEDGSGMPFSIAVKYHSTLPESSEQAQIGISVSMKDRQVQEGEVTEAVVGIVNKSDQPIPTPVAIVGIPGGLEVRHDQLKELVKAGRIDAYEVNGREVVLYWRALKAKETFDLPLSLVAAIPGSYTGPASRAYLYYTDEYKNWAPGLTVSITAR